MKDGKRPEVEVRERLEDIRAALFMRFGEKGTKLLILGAFVAVVIILVAVVAFFSIRIDEISVMGDLTMFNEGEIVRAAEINEGDSLFLRSSRKVERELKKNLPLCEKAEVKKSLGGRIEITVDFKSVDFYCKIGEKYYAVDSSLCVLDSNKSKDKYEGYGATYVRLPETREAKLGERLVFFDTVEETDTEGETLYEVKEERFYYYVSDFLSSLEKSGFRQDTDAIILDEKFNVVLIYAEKFEVRLGDASDLPLKFRVLFEIIQEGSMQFSQKVAVDVSNPSKAVARGDDTIDLKEYFD